MTLLYPLNGKKPFIDMLSGKLTKILVRVELSSIPDSLHGDYINDKQFKRYFQHWLNKLWQEKDRQIAAIYQAEIEKEKKAKS